MNLKRVWLALALVTALIAAWLYFQVQMPQHMLAHLLLSLVVPPPLLLGLAGFRPRVPAWVGFLALASVTLLSHLPTSLAWVEREPALLGAEGALFLVAGLLFALALWQASVAALAATIGQMAVCALTGAWVAFGSRMEQGVAAGILMWVGGGLLYSVAALTIVGQLLSKEEGELSHVR